MTARIGTKIGNYELMALLNSGGTASLWKAKHTLSQKIVAIKILNEAVNIQRVRNEARLQSSVLHPNIVSIYEFIWMGNQPCIVMELVTGMALNDYLRQHKLSESQRINLVEQLLNAIQFLHEKKIIHRDLKPQNIMVKSDETLKLLDFGIAKGWSSPNLTKEGTAIGTPEYMAPERFEGQQSPQSDIWAIGLIIYEIFTAQPLFPKLRNTAERASYFAKSYIEPKLVNIKPPWKNIISKCLKTNPKYRYKSVRDILSDLSVNVNNRSLNWRVPELSIYLKITLLIVPLILAGYFIWSNFLNTTIVKECTGTEVEFFIKPSHALLETSRNEKLTKGNWNLCGEKGTSIKITISADGYLTKSKTFTFPTLDDKYTESLENK